MGQANLMATNRKDHQITKIVTTIVLVFLVLNIPRLGLGIFEISRYKLMVDCFNSPVGTYFGPEWQHMVDIMARYLAVLNSSINFIIYCVAGKQFRNVFFTLFHLKTETTIQNLAEERVTMFSTNLPIYSPYRT